MDTEKMIDMLYKYGNICTNIKESKDDNYKELLEECAEVIENCYGRDTELTNRIRDFLEKERNK